MKVISSAVDLAEVSGGEVTCEIGTGGIKCTGTLRDYYRDISAGFDKLQRWGGDLGIYIYEVTHKES